MKKIFVLVLLLVAIILVSCNPETPSESTPTESTPNESVQNESLPNESVDDVSTHVHDFSGKLQYDETGHWSTCECGEVSKSEHTMEEAEVIKEATCIEIGSKRNKCKDCGYSSEAPVAKIKHDYKDEFCTMCGTHRPSNEITFVNSDGYGLTAIFNKKVDAKDSQLSELYIPSYTETGNKVVAVKGFYALGNLKSVVIPDGIEYILNHAFDGCKKLEEVTFLCDPSSKIVIEEGAFTGCIGLKKVTLSDSDVTVGRFVFKDCYSLKEVDLGNGITKLSYEMFRGCSALESIVISDSVTEINSNVFYGCEKLKTVVLPKNLTEMRDFIFAACTSLESITIPKSIEYLGSGIFDNCKSLKEIKYEGTMEDWNNIPIVCKVFDGSSVERIICSDGVIEV